MEKYVLFLLNCDLFFKEQMDDRDIDITDVGVPPSLYLIPKEKRREVHDIARKSAIRCEEQQSEDPLPLFGIMLQEANIDFKVIGDVSIPYSQRQDKFLCDTLEVEIV